MQRSGRIYNFAQEVMTRTGESGVRLGDTGASHAQDDRSYGFYGSWDPLLDHLPGLQWSGAPAGSDTDTFQHFGTAERVGIAEHVVASTGRRAGAVPADDCAR